MFAKDTALAQLASVHTLPGASAPVDLRGRRLHDLRLSVTDRCNFRCPYCMPTERYHQHYRFLKSDERLDLAELARLARLFVQLGVRKLRITGGEPLLRSGLADLIGDLSTLPGVDDLALTTNGVLLAQHAVELRAAGLRRVTVSLDSLDPAVFARMAGGRGSPVDVLAGIDAARNAGLGPIKINAVIQRGVNDHTVLPLLEHFRGTGAIVRLIEYMDVGTRNDWQRTQVVPNRELLALIGAHWPLRPLEPSYRGEVASRYLYDDGAGEIGMISSVTQPFCGDCTRARLTSDGMLHTCLFSTRGTDLREPLRSGASDAELVALIGQRWALRDDRYSELRGLLPADAPRVEMNRVGG
jgi:cyclic pyranopterin phosphate synthase